MKHTIRTAHGWRFWCVSAHSLLKAEGNNNRAEE